VGYVVTQAFIQPAQEIYQKIQKGVYDVSNEQYGIKVGMASQPGTLPNNRTTTNTQSGGCC